MGANFNLACRINPHAMSFFLGRAKQGSKNSQK